MNDIDGGPAFPTDGEHQSGLNTWHHEGMSLRDYFAVHSVHPGAGEVAAIAGLTYRLGAVWSDADTRIGSFEDWFSRLPLTERLELFSSAKYAMADAMLIVRGRPVEVVPS